MDAPVCWPTEEEGWRRLQAAFARVPEDRFEEPTLTPDGWSPKDAMFHVGGLAGGLRAAAGRDPRTERSIARPTTPS